MVHKAYNKGYNMDTKEKDFKMLAARHQKPFRPLDLRAARHHKPFRLLQMSLKGATWLSQQANQPRVCQMMGHGGVSLTRYPGRPSLQPLLARSIM
jgi:hypothetical protein